MTTTNMKGTKRMTKWKPVTKYSKAVSNALKTYDRKSFELLCDMVVINHPAVRIPKRKTLVALINANPRADFLRRLPHREILSHRKASAGYRQSRADSLTNTSRDLTRSWPDSLAAALVAQPSMSLVPLAPFSTSLGMTIGCSALPFRAAHDLGAVDSVNDFYRAREWMKILSLRSSPDFRLH
jgi:hypothetical protein